MNLQELYLNEQKLSLESIKMLSSLDLKVLTLSKTKITLDGHCYPLELQSTALSYICECKSLELLDLEAWHICSQDLATISNLNELRSLQMINVSIVIQDQDKDQDQDDHLFTCFSRLSNLEELSLAHCDQKVILPFKQLPLLKLLDLCDCSITDLHIEGIETLLLKSLNLNRSLITDATLLKLKQITTLQVLNVSKCMYITPHGLRHLFSLRHLQYLSVEGCELGPNELVSLSDLKCLEQLDLGHNDILPRTTVSRLRKKNNLKIVRIQESTRKRFQDNDQWWCDGRIGVGILLVLLLLLWIQGRYINYNSNLEL